jgi:hypothetical protein
VSWSIHTLGALTKNDEPSNFLKNPEDDSFLECTDHIQSSMLILKSGGSRSCARFLGRSASCQIEDKSEKRIHGFHFLTQPLKALLRPAETGACGGRRAKVGVAGRRIPKAESRHDAECAGK